MQILRIDGTPTAATILKLLPHDTPSLPSTVKGIVRFDGLPSAATILKLFPTSYFLTNEDGDYITDENGNYFGILI